MTQSRIHAITKIIKPKYRQAPDQKVKSTLGDGLKSSNFIGRLSESISIMARPTMVTGMKLVDYIFLSKSTISLENLLHAYMTQ